MSPLFLQLFLYLAALNISMIRFDTRFHCSPFLGYQSFVRSSNSFLSSYSSLCRFPLPRAGLRCPSFPSLFPCFHWRPFSSFPPFLVTCRFSLLLLMVVLPVWTVLSPMCPRDSLAPLEQDSCCDTIGPRLRLNVPVLIRSTQAERASVFKRHRKTKMKNPCKEFRMVNK